LNANDFIAIFSNPVIPIIVAAVAGAFASNLVSLGIQMNKDRVFNENIKRIIKVELDSYYNFLNELLTKRERRDDGDVLFIQFGDDLITKIKSIMPDGNFKPVNYRNLDGETKAKTFTINTLTKLEQIYRDIEYFHGFEIKTLTGSGFNFTVSNVTKLVGDIKLAIEMISKRSWFDRKSKLKT